VLAQQAQHRTPPPQPPPPIRSPGVGQRERASRRFPASSKRMRSGAASGRGNQDKPQQAARGCWCKRHARAREQRTHPTSDELVDARVTWRRAGPRAPSSGSRGMRGLRSWPRAGHGRLSHITDSPPRCPRRCRRCAERGRIQFRSIIWTRASRRRPRHSGRSGTGTRLRAAEAVPSARRRPVRSVSTSTRTAVTAFLLPADGEDGPVAQLSGRRTGDQRIALATRTRFLFFFFFFEAPGDRKLRPGGRASSRTLFNDEETDCPAEAGAVARLR